MRRKIFEVSGACLVHLLIAGLGSPVKSMASLSHNDNLSYCRVTGVKLFPQASKLSVADAGSSLPVLRMLYQGYYTRVHPKGCLYPNHCNTMSVMLVPSLVIREPAEELHHFRKREQ